MDIMDIDAVRLNLNSGSMITLKVIIGIIMFGVALQLKPSDFIQLLKQPKAFLLGIIGHWVLMPLLTWALVMCLDLKPSIALGLVLVAASPGGNLSNVFTSLAGGNTALTVGLTSATTLSSLFLTPFLLVLLGHQVPGAEALLTEIKLDLWEVFEGVFLVLGIPLGLGMLVGRTFPSFSVRAHRVLAKVSFAFLIVFVVGAFAANYQHFLNYYQSIVGLSVLHAGLGFCLGLALGKVFRLSNRDTVGLILTQGVRNTALSLALVFQFFQGLGGMAMIVAFWGVTQIVFGIILSLLFKKMTFKT
jgi:bile acid:Na+ symporter, BASS family